jgi:hypothetical protein
MAKIFVGQNSRSLYLCNVLRINETPSCNISAEQNFRAMA